MAILGNTDNFTMGLFIFRYFVFTILVDYSLQACTTISLVNKDDRKVLTSPGYPTSYSNDLDMCWIIDTTSISKIVDETYIVQMNVNDTSMEIIGSSCYDYAEVLDGSTNTSTRLAKWCNTEPPIIVSSGSRMYVRFFSSSSNSGGAIFKGFSASLSVGIRAGVGSQSSNYAPKCIPMSLGDTSLTYTLTSLNYPALYANSMDQCWVLYVSDSIPTNINYRIRVKVIDSKLETSSTCHYDDVQIRDGDQSTSSLIKMWCGTTVPSTITSCYQKIYVRMRTDHFNNYRGFRALVNIVPKNEPCSLEAQPLSPGSIVGIVMGIVFTIVLVVVIVIVIRSVKKAPKTKVKRIKPKKRGDKEERQRVPAPTAKHPSYYNQTHPPPYGGGYPGDMMMQGLGVSPGYAGYTQPAAPAYHMTAGPRLMPDSMPAVS